MIQKKLGILGGGQLGRMSALAAARLGIQTVIYCPEQGCPASLVSAGTYFAAYDNQEALREFASFVDVITYEFENIPVETVHYLQNFKPVYPDERLLEVAQDRIKEKKFLNDIGISTAKWSSIKKFKDIDSVFQEWGEEDFILKTTRFGYDGKGQARFGKQGDAKQIWQDLGGVPLIAEQIVPFEAELSMIIARDKLGQMVTYGPMLNEHKNGILHKTIAPAPAYLLNDEIIQNAKKMVQLLAEAVDLTGVLTIEMFLTKEGHLLANEIAPRTHNSGHWTIDACAVSQFENHVRTVCGLTVGMPGQHSAAEMLNLIGDDVRGIARYLEQPNACLHLYGKHEARPGRKMGHVNFLSKL
ncbi:MAG: 5-(carboxyamino)imidazole ribonucleotide synthase [Rhodospirillales bacterium]|nr:5-(carboxyamino)imidazole ribonucleotide synthase [Rhodospirillales bacterium]